LHAHGDVLRDDGTRGLSRQAIGAAIRVHRRYGPGLLENAYRVPYVYELEKLGLTVECERPLPLVHECVRVECAYKLDIVVEGRLVIEVKSVRQLALVHIQQLRTYLRLSGIPVGLLMNFNVPILRHAIRRVILHER
jgi:GxxExxY protein